MSKKKTKQAAAKRLRLFYGGLGLAVVVGAIAIGLAVAGQRGPGASMEPVELTDVADARSLMDLARPETIGAEDAPVTLVVFNDFECPFCAQFALQVKPALKSEYVDDGKLRVVYYDFPLPGRAHSFAAARAARCAGDQGQFWEYHDLLLAEQSNWSRRSNALGDFVSYAQRTGLDAAGFEGCLRSDEHARTVTANLRMGEQIGVRGTPTVFVNGRQVENWAYNTLKGRIDAELDG